MKYTDRQIIKSPIQLQNSFDIFLFKLRIVQLSFENRNKKWLANDFWKYISIDWLKWIDVEYSISDVLIEVLNKS